MLLTFQEDVFTNVSEGRKYIIASNSSIEPDIRQRYADFGLLGSDKYGEIEDTSGLQFEPVGKLVCRFVFAMPIGFTFAAGVKLRTATSYPRALSAFLGDTGINASVGPIRLGKVEGAISQGIAEAVFDICETGNTLSANNLEVVAEAQDYLELGGLWRKEEVQ